MYYLIFAVAYLIDPLIFFVGCFHYLRPKYQNKLLYIAAFVVLYAFVDGKQFLLHRNIMPELSFFLFPFLMAVMYCIVHILFLGSRKKKTAYLITFFLISIVADGIMFLALTLMEISDRIIFSVSLAGAVITAFSRLICIIFSLAVFHFLSEEMLEKNIHGMAGIIIYGIISASCFGVSLFYLGAGKPTITGFIAGVYVVLTVMFTVCLCRLFLEKERSEAEANTRAELAEQQMHLISHAMNITDELRMLRHDAKSHFMLIQDLVNRKEYGLLKKYMKQLCKDVNRVTEVCLCDNYVLSTILTRKAKEAREQEIRFMHVITVMKFPVSYYEQNSLFSNILDNAFEAVRKIPKGQERVVDFEIKYNQLKNIVITCTNTIAEIPVKNSDRYMVTTKQDRKNHGFGMRAIQKIVDKNGGFLNYTYDETKFTIKVYLFDSKQVLNTQHGGEKDEMDDSQKSS